MNSSATRAHLQSRLATATKGYERSREIALRPWGDEGWDTRTWHLRHAERCSQRRARLEVAIIYLGMRMERARSR